MGIQPAVAVNADIPILEREQQLSALRECAAEAERGDGRLVLVAGEAGVGKSTLVESLAARLSGAEWLQGGCDGMFTPRPLGPLLDIAARAGGELARLVREGAAREELFAALLARIGDPDRLTVVVVEDIHWADEATLDLVRYLGRRLSGIRALLLATYRDDELPARKRLRITVGDLARQRATRRVQLRALSLDAVTELSRPWGQDPEALHRLTGGNPFFVTEILRGPPHGVGTALPPSVRDAVLARAASLSHAPRAALEFAALLGATVDVSLLVAASEQPISAVDELLEHGLLLGDGARVRFRHELSRLALEDEVPGHRRPLLHRRILDALVATGCDDDARLAFHAECCGDSAAVLAHAPQAARQAAVLGSARESATQYQRALSFSDGADAATRAALYDGLADQLVFLDELSPAMEARAEAIPLWVQLGDIRREADSLRRYMWVLHASSRPDDALVSCDRAVRLLTPLGPSTELAWAEAARARILMLQGDNDAALRCARDAQELAEALGLADVMSDALNTEACSKACLGLPWGAQMDRALELAVALPDPPLEQRARYNTFCHLLGGLRFEEAEACYQQAVAHADAHDLETYSRCLRRERAMALVVMGRWDEAIAVARAQTDELEGAPQHRILPRLVVALVSARRGDDDDVQEILDEALRLAEPTGQPQFLVPVRVARAEVAWLRGDVDGAWKEIALARDLAAEERRLIRMTELWGQRTGLGGVADDHVAAVGLELGGAAASAARQWDDLSCPYDAAMALLGSDQEEHLREAVVRFDALGAVVPARIARQMMRDRGIRSIPTGTRATTRAHPKGLTQREQEVLDLVAAGCRNRDIAERLFLSPKTVSVHVSSILRKLEVTGRAEAVAWAHREGIVAI